jgi:hypothetical protein
MDQVSKLTGTVLGVGKKPTTNQSQTLAAQAAKKVTPPLTSGLPLPQTSRPQDQEDKEKKAQRLRNQETRRLLAQQRKADEDKARMDGEQKRVKEDMERRKREREETTDKRPIKLPTKKVRASEFHRVFELTLPQVGNDDTTKRKLAEVPKKPATKPAPPKDKAPPRSAIKKPNLLGSSQDSGASSSQPRSQPQAQSQDDYDHPPAAKAVQKAKAPARPAPATKERSENIELPDIASEYSDSDDESKESKKRLQPGWTHSPDVRQKLEEQRNINPDDVFGAIPEPQMAEIFKSHSSKFRARTSSANWGGTDRLTMEEEQEYAVRMGYQR